MPVCSNLVLSREKGEQYVLLHGIMRVSMDEVTEEVSWMGEVLLN